MSKDVMDIQEKFADMVIDFADKNDLIMTICASNFIDEDPDEEHFEFATCFEYKKENSNTDTITVAQ